MTTLFVLGAARRGGSEGLARLAAEALPDGQARFVSLLDYESPPRDHRHDGEAWQAPEAYGPGPLRTLYEATLGAERIVLVTPLCWPRNGRVDRPDWPSSTSTGGGHGRRRGTGSRKSCAGARWGRSWASGSEDEGVAAALTGMLTRTADTMGMA